MRRVVMAACAALMFVPIYFKSRTGQELPARAAFEVLSTGEMLVKVSGDVKHPGIYKVSDNTLADTVIIMADGSGAHENLQFEASRALMNGSEVRVSRNSNGFRSVTIGQMPVSERIILGIPLDICTMTEEDFDRLPGVGPALAKRIIEYRQKNGGILRFKDLAMIEGIGEKKLEALRKIIQPAVNIK